MKAVITITYEKNDTTGEEIIDYSVDYYSNSENSEVPDSEVFGIIEKAKMLLLLENYGIIQGDDE